jgi:hypothetical protein
MPVPHSQQCTARGHTPLDGSDRHYIGQPPIVRRRVSGLEVFATMLRGIIDDGTCDKRQSWLLCEWLLDTIQVMAIPVVIMNLNVLTFGRR